MVSVTLTISTPTALGRMCLKMIRALLAPEIRAASTNSRSRRDEEFAAHQARQAHPADQAKEDAQHKDAVGAGEGGEPAA